MELAIATSIPPQAWEEAGLDAIHTAVEVLNDRARQ